MDPFNRRALVQHGNQGRDRGASRYAKDIGIGQWIAYQDLHQGAGE